MRKIILLANIMALFLFLVGCGKNSAPSCADSNAKKIVMDLATKELKNTIEEVTSIGEDDTPKELTELEISSLDSIRTNKKDDAVKKSECAAELTFANKSNFSIEYTAQYTEDGEVIVEVFGLKEFFEALAKSAASEIFMKSYQRESQQRNAEFQARRQEAAKQLALLQARQQEAQHLATQQQAVQQVTTPASKPEESPVANSSAQKAEQANENEQEKPDVAQLKQDTEASEQAATRTSVVVPVETQTESTSDKSVDSQMYKARLSEKDHSNSSGQRLNTVGAILRQDRANFHTFNIRDAEDESDKVFKNKEARVNIESAVKRAKISKTTEEAILNGTPVVQVKIVDGGIMEVTLIEQ